MKNAVKVICFTLAILLAGSAGIFGYIRFNQTEFGYTEGTESGTVTITSYNGQDKDIVIPSRIKGKKVTRIDGLAFEESDITSVEIGRNVTYIGKSAFRGCTSLKTVKLGASVKGIDDSCFNNCSSLEEIKFPKSLETIGINLFDGCTAMKKVEFESDESFVIKDDIVFSADMKVLYFALPYAQLGNYVCPDSVEKLSEFPFGQNSTLTGFTFSDKITVVPKAMLMGCKNITELVIPDTVTKIESIVTVNSGIKSITIPASVKIIDKSAFITTEEGTETDIVIRTTKDSKADIFAKENNMKVEYIK